MSKFDAEMLAGSDHFCVRVEHNLYIFSR